MRCPACDADNSEGARFCGACGRRLTAACPHCGARVPIGLRFCTACGGAITAAAGPGDGPGGADVGAPAERRRISVLFVDLEDFTSTAEGLDPEEVRSVQSRYFAAARSIIGSYGGTIEKFIGDAVVAVWGAPTAHEDDAERAVLAGLQVSDAVPRLASPDSGVPLTARAAVATGEAAVSVEARDQGLASGDVMNRAARLQSSASPGTVVVDEASRSAVAGRIEFRSLGELSLRGKSAPVAAFQALGPAEAGGGRAAGHAGPFVGRDRELHELLVLLDAVVRDRRSRLVSMIGIAGIGKSRLAWEFERAVDARPMIVAWHTGRTAAYGEGVAFAPLAEMIRRRAGISERTDVEQSRAQLATALVDLVSNPDERSWLEPRLATLLAASSGPEFEREELFAAWRRFFERVADRSPTVLVFEDLQWADPALLDFIEHLTAWARDHPILVVTLARPELLDHRVGWGATQRSFTAMRIDRLRDEAMAELLEGRIPGVPAAAVRHILDRAGGVPLYAVEVVRMLTDRGVLAERAGRFRLMQQLRPGDVPDSLHGTLAARIDALPAAHRRLLRSAALLGRRFHPDALRAVARLEPSETQMRIAGLVERELLAFDDEPRSPGRGQLVFVQDLLREHAYRTLSRSERRTGHLAAAGHLEAMEDEDLVEAIAGHLAAAYEADAGHPDAPTIGRRASTTLRRAARRAVVLNAPHRALENLERAVAMTASDERAELWEEAAAAARSAGRLDVAERYLRELEAFRAARGERTAADRARAQLASVLLTAHQNERAIAELETAMESIADIRDAAGVELAGQLARAKTLVGDDAAGLEWAKKSVSAAAGVGARAAGIDALVTRGTARFRLGDERGGAADLERAVEEARGAGLVTTELRARNNLAWLSVADNPQFTFATARAGDRLATDLGLADWVMQFVDVELATALDTGDWAWALERYANLTEHPITPGIHVGLAAEAAILHLVRGDATPLAELDALEPIDVDVDPQDLASVHYARAWAALLDGRFPEAREEAEAAAAASLGVARHQALLLAVRASLWRRDAAAVRSGLAALADLGIAGRFVEAGRTTLAGGLAALEGDPDADRIFDAVTARWRDLGLPLPLALALFEQHWLRGARGRNGRGGRDPEGSEAFAILNDLGGVGLSRALLAIADHEDARAARDV